LFATYPCVAQARTSADELRASLFRGNLLWIADVQPRLASTVTICLVAVPNRLIVSVAETFADQLFASIRVKIQWHGPRVCPANARAPIFLTIQERTPESYFPGALGVALPLEGSHAWVFYDRVLQATPDDKRLSALLAHVMAHEIAHVLQGIIRHSESGILKAHWSETDCARMAFFPLMFTRDDAILIHRGLEDRFARLASNPSPGNPKNRSGSMSPPREQLLPLP
jgi:hypothetical protein